MTSVQHFWLTSLVMAAVLAGGSWLILGEFTLSVVVIAVSFGLLTAGGIAMATAARRSVGF